MLSFFETLLRIELFKKGVLSFYCWEFRSKWGIVEPAGKGWSEVYSRERGDFQKIFESFDDLFFSLIKLFFGLLLKFHKSIYQLCWKNFCSPTKLLYIVAKGACREFLWAVGRELMAHNSTKGAYWVAKSSNPWEDWVEGRLSTTPLPLS